ncbi:MAG: FprA family A-type flavoprotein [Rikenellaceae bacterium]
MKYDINDSILYIGVDDKTIDLFESQYIVPNGISYNSYLIMDEKIAVFDTVDNRKLDEWEENLEKSLSDRTPNYMVIQHMEPDHAAGIERFAAKYPEAKFVVNSKILAMIPQFFTIDLADRAIVVKEGETLSLGEHVLQFFMAPMVHWPEVMVTYEQKSKTLFSADGFGKFGALDVEENWACEARRYYFNIVGKYGANVQALLKKLSGVEVNAIAPLHGPILKENLVYYLSLYNTWSSYEPEEENAIFIAYASIHGNSAKVAKLLAEKLEKRGGKEVIINDLAREDQAEAVENAFLAKKLVVVASSYDAGVFPPMEHFLHHLKSKNYQKRDVAIIENGSWAPTAGKVMRAQLEQMKNLNIREELITIRSTYKPENEAQLDSLCDWLYQ